MGLFALVIIGIVIYASFLAIVAAPLWIQLWAGYTATVLGCFWAAGGFESP
jgi:hypothetical protein